MPGVPAGAAEFNRLLFAVAQDHVDPDHGRLQWSEGFTGTTGGDIREWGRKFGWQVPGERGQAMLYIGVGNVPPPTGWGVASTTTRERERARRPPCPTVSRCR
jgi:hypothetical protein